MSEPRGRIAELFTSLQGEGVTAGVPSVFIRLQGCSVGCVWCDTKYSWDPTKGEPWTVEAILEKITLTSLKNVVVTGGEPLESPLFVPLVSELKAQGYRVEAETAGVVEPPDLPVDQWNVSIKLAHSGVPEERRIRPQAIRDFVAGDAWFKFVVAQPADVDEVLELQKRFSLPQERILLMPEGIERGALLDRSRWVWEACQSHGFRFSPRLHILLFGAKRGV
jgi:organic radical activating enzyme